VCEAVVADPKDRVERFGSHVHERVNPGGFTFVIGCFSRAEGVMEVGEESDELSLFSAACLVLRCLRVLWCAPRLALQPGYGWTRRADLGSALGVTSWTKLR